jgi:thiol-disulfide isomerase/thioredoxin
MRPTLFSGALLSRIFALLVLPSAWWMTASAKDLTPEERTAISAKWSEARSLRQTKEYAKSNEVLAEILKLLPDAGPGLDQTRSYVLYEMAGNHARLDDKKLALSHLEQAIERGYWDHEFIQSDPSLASVHSEKEFSRLIEKSRRGLANMILGRKDLSGNEITKESLEKKVVVLDVWGTWCPPCRGEIPHYVRLQEAYRDKGVQVIGLAWERQEANEAIERRVKTFATQNKMNYPVVLATEAMIQAIPNLRGFPTTFFIGRDGTVRQRIVGGKDYSQMVAAITPLIAE